MLKKLQVQKGNVVNKMRNMETWRPAVSAPPLVTTLATAVVVPLGSMGKWVNSFWKKYKTKLKEKRELINAMRMGSFIVIKDLDNIKALGGFEENFSDFVCGWGWLPCPKPAPLPSLTLVDTLGVEMEGLVRNAQFAISKDEKKAVGIGVGGVWRGRWGPLMADSGESGGWEEEVWWSDGGGRG
ncbi:UPF0496 protein 1-like protein [Tanacetum coccineum]